MNAQAAPAPRSDDATLDVAALRAQFPILSTQVDGRPLVYLDSAASTQQPQAVIAAVSDYHRSAHANIHRGNYRLSQHATRLYEHARAAVARFLNAAEPAECVFTRGTTEAINLVAATWGRANLGPGDEILLSNLEHHSNIVPWQMVAEQTGARIRVIPIDDAGDIDLDAYRRLLSPRTRLVGVNQVSNALGTVNPVREIIELAHAHGALVLVDGAQWVAHGRTDVRALDADFYAFSGHKLYGPTGIGVLYAKRALLEAMPPYQGGGDMIEQVSFEATRYAAPPTRFEAGTPNISGAVGLGAAIDWIESVGFERISAHEQWLLRHATERLEAIPGLALKGRAQRRSCVTSWVMEAPAISSLDLGTALDLRGICVRTGHHCCQPLMERLGVAATVRASFGVYNTLEEIDTLADALIEIADETRARQARVAPVAETALDYPGPSAESPAAAAAQIAEDFELLPDWPTRHEYIIDLGGRLPHLPASMQNAATHVQGCQSQVYIAARAMPDDPERVEFLADSDAELVRGLIALLQQLYSGQRARDILDFDARAFFAQLGLDGHLSMNRRNGLEAMVQRLRQVAARQVAADA
ncbi:SufS family cysteine desulfurase [Marichromatium sp. AB31]|uniref:SufS family cysteine desulfurase n=1 Tax=Marichromatium sp. AB31 TaxID=2483362 RepID=UPI000F3C02FC|nr:SufS family cysteine desulfurase [Marichromatium sp. AB31]RNE89400.1 SufS family cysteine desulfurase [Marichromatium sp. AB31]